MDSAPHILVVDDDREIRDLLSRFLEKQGMRVTAARDAREARRAWPLGRYHLVVLDLMMPGEPGLDFARWLRTQSDVPIVILTAMGEETDRIVGLELGADDYVPKPCLPRALAAGLRAILRRSQPGGETAAQASLVVGPLKVMPAHWRVEWDGAPVELTSTEFYLLEVLARNAGRPVSKAELSAQALGRTLVRFDRSVDVHLASIRHKLGQLPGGRSCIQTVYHQGYQLIRG
jgi:two-component system OmpR family response regulator/two-component system response regulator CpxR